MSARVCSSSFQHFAPSRSFHVAVDAGQLFPEGRGSDVVEHEAAAREIGAQPRVHPFLIVALQPDVLPHVPIDDRP